MNKQNLFIITNVKRHLSLKKQKSQTNQSSNLLVKNINNYQNHHHASSSSSSKINKQQYNQSKPKLVQSGHLRSKAKAPLKLRILSQTNNQNVSKQRLNNTTKSKNVLQKIHDIVEGQLVYQLIQNEGLPKYSQNQFIIKPQTLASLLEKIILFICKLKQPPSSQQIVPLSSSLRKISGLIHAAAAQIKRNKNHLYNCRSLATVNDDYLQNLKAKRSQLQRLNEDRLNAIEQLSDLNTQKLAITAFNQQKKKQIQKEDEQITKKLKKLEELKLSQSTLTNEIQYYQSVLSNCEKKYEEIVNFVQIQNKNQHIKLASQDYKYIQSEIYQYAAYLQANQLATSETYESIPFKNQCFIIANLQNALRDINIKIIQNDSINLTDKLKMMRDFLMEAYQEFKKKDSEYQKLIEFKTRSIRKFVDMMKKWLNNWTLKQEYLVNLRKQFAVDSRALLENVEDVQHKLCLNCVSTTRQSCNKFKQLFKAIQENYKLGNSFY